MADGLLQRLVVKRKNGNELFSEGAISLDFNLLSFWQWSASDLVSNALRGRLAEFLVAQALGIAAGVRAEWDAYDLRSTSGQSIEVKSSAYLQTWTQKALSVITFDIAPTRYWDATTNELAHESRRQADLYVFSLLAHRDKATVNPMDVLQWHFFVLNTDVLNTILKSQKHLSLSALLRLNPVPCRFSELRSAIDRLPDR